MRPFYDPDDEPPLDDLVHHGRAIRRPMLSGQDKALLPLAWKDDRWTVVVESYFRPMGLIATNAPRRGGFVAEWRCGMDLVIQSHRPISLDVFAYIETLGQDAACRPTFPTLSPGHTLELSVLDADGLPYGPPLELTVWGLSARYI